MPTYEFQCPNGHAFEKILKITSDARVKCPTCGKVATRKISGGAGLVFKGSGFYITDYGKDGKGPRKESSEKSDSTPAAPAADAKPDAKPAKAETPKTETPKSSKRSGKAKE
jgi:putative FmdB family regulatory protein